MAVPVIAIIDNNVLAAVGLQQILEGVMPVAEVRIHGSFQDLLDADCSSVVHYFVSSRIFLEHRAYFLELSRMTMVLVSGEMLIPGMKTLNVCQTESDLVKSIIALYERGHAPSHSSSSGPAPILTSREIEVAVLLAKGCISKEIADRLHISVTTVITHRRNIMAKLQAKSLADVIIHVVLEGFVDVGDL